MKPISEYIEEVKKWQRTNRDARMLNWPELLDRAGYYRADLRNRKEFYDVYEWCNKHVGIGHYAFSGKIFYFDREQDAVLFILKWS